MKKAAIVFWSGTGNTEAMALSIKEGIASAGGDITMYTAGEFSVDQMDGYDVIAFGCPSMGAEELEDMEFEPMFLNCIPKLSDKPIALFGSYGWGDGQWMRDWEERCLQMGARLAHESVICQDAPDDSIRDTLLAMGRALAG
ncbi:MAG: flavodoxin, short chain [Oscillospiraceae bacterium]|nr:flavodoxin, short chain [Oscillospiraceae bacterium]